MSNGHNIRAVACGEEPFDRHRTFLEIHADDTPGDGVDVVFAEGRAFHIKPGESWRPTNVPMSVFVATGDGTMLIS